MRTILGTGYSKLGHRLGIFSFHLKAICLLSVIYCGSIMSISAQTFNNSTASSSQKNIHVSTEEMEALIDSLSIDQLKAEVLTAIKKKGLSPDLFTFFLDNKIQEDRIEFFRQINLGIINASTVRSYIENKKQSYINSYNDFLLVKNKLALQIAANTSSTLAVNGPCTNIDFENGSTSGWQTSNADACKNPTPCNANYTGATRLQVTTKSMTDPYIPGLSLVNPLSGNYSVRMEDYVNGGNATVMRQTFQVSATNNVFTYHYAAVLEDPQQNHSDSERPYFKVRMYDASGNEIKCASFEAIAKPPINNFTHVSVTNPNAGVNGGANTLELYYRDWSTVSIPLLSYIGQNVTIEFSVSDCSRGAHLGYAYVDAECFQLTPSVPNDICGNQTTTITASSGFAGYSWSGPGIVGPSNNQTVKVNKPGNYSVLFTPFADNPCPVTLSVKVVEHCKPSPITATLCEDVYGTLTVNQVNLSNYATNITSYHTPPGTVVSWHKAFPASGSNKITDPTKVIVKNGDKFYAVINYAIPGSDTAQIKFTINSKPLVNFPSIPSVCIGSSAFQINGITPAGGIFSGSNVNASGNFNPSTAGIFKIKYSYTNSSGCIDSANQNITVVSKPTVNAGPDQTICSNATSISLNGKSTNFSSVIWSGGSGTFNSSTSAVTSYTPTTSELSSASFILTLTAKGIAPCAALSDQIKVSVQPVPVVDAGPTQTHCSTNPIFTLNGSSSNSLIGQWSGGKGSFSNSNSPSPTYTATQDEINAGTVTLNYSVANTMATCPNSTDNVVLTIIKEPTIEAGPSQQLCANTSSILLTAKSTNTLSSQWSGGLGSFASPASPSTVYTPTISEISSGNISLTITAKGNAPCASVTDNVSITFIPIAKINAGNAQKLCADAQSISLTGTGSNYSGIAWSGGGGSYSSSQNLQSTYIPTESEKQSGQIILTITAKGNTPCPDAKSTTTINFVKVPTVEAGQPQTICASSNSIVLNGSSSNSSSVQWSGGAGSFSSSNSLQTSYKPTDAEKLSGSVVLNLTALPNTPCTSVNDNVKISFDQVPKVTTPANPTVCGNNAAITLTGTVSNASNVVWTGGKGNYSPSANSLTITYTPTSEEIKAGSATLSLTSVKNSTCDVASSSVTIAITAPPVVDAGFPQTICASNNSVVLNGSTSNSSSVQWSGGSGSFSSSNSLQTTYYPTDAEKLSGTVILNLAALPNNPCNTINDNVKISFDQVPIVTTPINPTVCGNNAATALTGTVTNASNTVWSGGKGSYDPSVNSLAITYTPTSEEIKAGSATLSLTSVKNSTCDVASSSVTIAITAPPVVDAGNPIATCVNQPKVQLNGNVTGSTNYQWSTSENGTFNPAINILNPNYSLSESELAKGETTLTLTAFVPLCLPVSDIVTIKTLPLPTPDLGPDKSICEGTSLSLGTLALNGATYSWTKNDLPLLQNTNSISTISETGTVKYVVEVLDINSCANKDSILVKGLPMPIIALDDTSTCDGTPVTWIASILNLKDLMPYSPIISWQKDGKDLGVNAGQLITKESGLYTFTVNSANCISSDKGTLVINPLPVIKLPASFTYCKDDNVGATIDAGPGFHYSWDNGFSTDQVVTLGKPGIHTLTVTDQFNCSASISTLIRDICPPRLFIGDAFSPDNDGTNDYYNVYGDHIGKFHMLIFNRWGEIIFESFDRLNPWNGIYREELIPIGVYPWRITYEGDSEEFKGPYKMEGSVTVIR